MSLLIQIISPAILTGIVYGFVNWVHIRRINKNYERFTQEIIDIIIKYNNDWTDNTLKPTVLELIEDIFQDKKRRIQ